MDYIEYLIDGLEEDGYEYEVQENSDEAVVILVEHSGVVVKILCVGNFINLSTILEDVEISYSDCYGKKSDKRKERLNRLNLENEDYRFTNELGTLTMERGIIMMVDYDKLIASKILLECLQLCMYCNWLRSEEQRRNEK